MTTTEQPTPDLDPRWAAGEARSILACPSAASLVIEAEEQSVIEQVGLADHRGTPTFLCLADSPLARAASSGRSARLTVTSGLGPRDGTSRDDTLTLTGRLVRSGFERCTCCPEMHHLVSLDPDLVLLARAGGSDADVPDRPLQVPLEDFRSAEHHLNRGHLQRSTEHANDWHHDELRHAVALGTNTRLGDLIGVRIAQLSPSGVTLRWVDVGGAHQRSVAFPRRARDLAELGELLRRQLHAGIC